MELLNRSQIDLSTPGPAHDGFLVFEILLNSLHASKPSMQVDILSKSTSISIAKVF